MGPFLPNDRERYIAKRYFRLWSICVCAFVFFLVNPAFSQTQLKIFKLQNRMASEIIPVIEPLLQGNGTVTGMNDQLIVRSTTQNLQMIQGLLSQLDTRLRNLRITVRQGVSGKRQRFSADVGANIPFSGGRGRVIIPPANRGGGGVTGAIGGNNGVVSGTIGQGTRTLDERHTQQVTTLEGRPANIYISQRVPIQTTVTQGVGPFATRSQNTTFEDVPTGFSVLPKVSGDRVTLEIHPQVSKLNSRGIQVQEVHTTASGKIGEWIEIGGLLTHSNESNSRILGSSQSRNHENRSVFFKVEVAD